MIYNEQIEALFFNARHVGVLDCLEPLTICSRKQLSTNSTKTSELYLRCDESGLITQARFKVTGNPYLIASFEYLCRHVVHTAIQEPPTLDHIFLIKALSIPAIHYAPVLLVEAHYYHALELLKKIFGEKS